MSLNGGPAGRAIELKITSDRFEETLATGATMRKKLTTYDGVFDIDDNRAMPMLLAPCGQRRHLRDEVGVRDDHVVVGVAVRVVLCHLLASICVCAAPT